MVSSSVIAVTVFRQQRIAVKVVVQFDKSLDDVKDGYQAGENFLGKPGEEPHQDGPLDTGDGERDHTHPAANVDPSGEKVKTINRAEVVQGLVEEQQGSGGADDDQRLRRKQGHDHAGEARRHEGLGYSDHVVRLVAHQTAEGDGRAQGGEVHENRRGQAGRVQAVG